MLGLDRVYHAHEYLDEHWELLHFSDLALYERPTRLCGVGHPYGNLDSYAVPPALMPLMQETGDPIMHETLCFDGFGATFHSRPGDADGTRTSPATLRTWLCADHPAKAGYIRVSRTADAAQRQAGVLAEKPASFDERAALPVYHGKIALLLDCLCLLVSSGQVAPVIAAEEIDREPTQRFNRMIEDFTRTGRNYGAWLRPCCDRARGGRPGSPRTGSGL